MQVKANSLKMIDGVSLFFQTPLRAYGSEIANEQWERVSAASICFYPRPCHVNHYTHMMSSSRAVLQLAWRKFANPFLPCNPIDHGPPAD